MLAFSACVRVLCRDLFYKLIVVRSSNLITLVNASDWNHLYSAIGVFKRVLYQISFAY